MAGMRVRLVDGPRWVVAATCVLAAVVATLAGCDTGAAASGPTSSGRASIPLDDNVIRVLQLNLCNSGRARCYSGGRAVGTAVTLIQEHEPDVVTVNEVCRDDVPELERALAAAQPTADVSSAFAPAQDRLTQGPVRCRNGEDFGDGVVVAAAPPAVKARSDTGLYPVQDPGDPEERVWVCLDLPNRFSACTTHTASRDAGVALSQCRHFLGSVAPGLSRTGRPGPVVLGADLNLRGDGAGGAEACLPEGYRRADDGSLQDVVVSPGGAIASRAVLDMGGTTDHPGLLVDVVLPPR